MKKLFNLLFTKSEQSAINSQPLPSKRKQKSYYYVNVWDNGRITKLDIRATSPYAALEEAKRLRPDCTCRLAN